MAKVTAIQPAKSKPAFNPQSNYKWEPTDVFEITGQQLAALYHCLSKEVNDPQGATVALKYEAFTTVMDVFKRGVEQGAIVEMDAPTEELVEEVEEKVGKLFKPRFSDDYHHNHPNS
mgnify:CR=1 FL=1